MKSSSTSEVSVYQANWIGVSKETADIEWRSKKNVEIKSVFIHTS